MNSKEIPQIPPPLHGNEYVKDFKKKAEIFTSFFTFISNSIELPLNLNYATEKCLDALNLSDNDLEKIIQNLDPNKAHGYDKINIRMINICSNSIYKPLELVFNQWINTGSFPLEKSQ